MEAGLAGNIKQGNQRRHYAYGRGYTCGPVGKFFRPAPNSYVSAAILVSCRFFVAVYVLDAIGRADILDCRIFPCALRV